MEAKFSRMDDFINFHPSMAFLDQGRARFYNGKGVDPVTIPSVLDVHQTDPALAFLDTFSRPPWTEPELKRFSTLGERLSRTYSERTYQNIHGLKDTQTEWVFNADSYQLLRTVQERSHYGHTLGKAHVSYEPFKLDGMFFPPELGTQFSYRYRSVNGEIEPTDFRFNAQLGIERSLVSAFYDSDGFMRAFGMYVDSIPTLLDSIDETNELSKDLLRNTQGTDYKAYLELLDENLVERVNKKSSLYMYGFMRREGVRMFWAQSPELYFDSNPTIDSTENNYLGFKGMKECSEGEMNDFFNRVPYWPERKKATITLNNRVITISGKHNLVITTANKETPDNPELHVSLSRFVRTQSMGRDMKTEKPVSGSRAIRKFPGEITIPPLVA